LKLFFAFATGVDAACAVHYAFVHDANWCAFFAGATAMLLIVALDKDN